MSIWSKIFKSKELDKPTQSRSKYLPSQKLPIDERFALNFRANGGKFIYCLNLDEVLAAFENILKENSWKGLESLCFNSNLRDRFDGYDIKFSKSNLNSPFFLTTCEYLIADTGAIMVCSNQLGEKKVKDLPASFIVLSTTSQMVENLGNGLSGIKSRYGTRLPSNITTLKHFESRGDNDFLSYGSSAKNLYLLLQEDL